MLTPTHLLTTQAAYLDSCIAQGHSPAPPETAVALLAGIAPDLDQRQGIVGRLAPWLSGPIEHAVGHRTATHSISDRMTETGAGYRFEA